MVKQKKQTRKKLAVREPKRRRGPKRSRSLVKAGRPAKWEPGLCARAERLAARCLDDETLAEAMGLAISTLRKYRSERTEFAAAIERGRRLSAEHIEYHYRRLAVPHDVRTTRTKISSTPDGEVEETVTTIEHDVMSEAAARNLLAADDPRRFGGRIEHRGEVKVGGLKELLSEIAAGGPALPCGEGT